MTIHAVIGVEHIDHSGTFYVRRSEKLKNYPGVWSLPSIQFKPEELSDQLDLSSASVLFERMRKERFTEVMERIRVQRYLTSGICADNPMGERVELHLYQVTLYMPTLYHYFNYDVLDRRPKDRAIEPLNGVFYTDWAYLSPEAYQERAAEQGGTCGFCMRLWSDYAVKHGLAKERFAPTP